MGGDAIPVRTSLTRRRIAKGAAVAVAVFVGFGLVTDRIQNQIWVRMAPRTPLYYAFLGATAVLAGAYVVQQVALDDAPGDACAYGGTIGGFLAFGCPICNKLLVVAFSSSAIMTYFEPLRPVLGILSVGLFAGVVAYRQRQYTRRAGGRSRSADD